MTLPCDASRQAYPENRIGHFTTVLAREATLDGEYEVGLSECVIPVPKRSLNFTQPIIYTEKGVTVAPAYFMVDATEINSLTDFQEISLPQTRNGKNVFEFSVRDKKIVLSVAPNCEVFFNDKENKDLAVLLGFKQGRYVGGKLEYEDYVAPRPFAVGGMLSFIYIYCDLVEYSYVGDTMVPCLRNLPVIPGENKVTVLRFENPHYVPVNMSRFSQVSIVIANDQGEEIKSAKGLSLFKLHFRPKKK